MKSSSTYRLEDEVKEIRKEIEIFSLLYLIIGEQLQEYPDNFAFDVSSRLLSLYGRKTYITKLIKQLDEESIRYCSLIVPYYQIQPPGTGLIYSINRHTSSVLDLDFTDDEAILISLSNRIVVVNMHEAKIVLDINLPTLNEPYLNSTTLTEVSNGQMINKTSSTDQKDQYKKYFFLVNSLHHIYLISADENIKFERSSDDGFLTVQILDKKRALCLIAENNVNSIECWNLITKKLFHRIDYPNSTVKNVLYHQSLSMIIIVLQDATIHLHSINDWDESSFTYRGSINGGDHLHLVYIDEDMLILTFDSTIPIDFAFIPLKQFHSSDRILTDNEVVKTLITFDPPIEPKPMKILIFPNKTSMSQIDTQSKFPLFIVKTNDCLYVIHKCKENDISYVRIDGRFDYVTFHIKYPTAIHTARGGTLKLYKWSCPKNEDDQKKKKNHKYHLYFSLDINASLITSIIAPAIDGSYTFFFLTCTSLCFCSIVIFMFNGKWSD